MHGTMHINKIIKEYENENTKIMWAHNFRVITHLETNAGYILSAHTIFIFR